MNTAPEKIAYPVPDGAKAIGVGETFLWGEIRLKKIQAVRAGRRTLIPADELRKYIANLPEAR